MLWKFAEYSDSGQGPKARTEEKIRSWWGQFESTVKPLRLVGRTDYDELVKFMATTLAEIDERIQWEYALRPHGIHGLALTPQVERAIRPMVESMVAMAPPLDGWQFFPYKQPRPLPDAVSGVEGQTGCDLSGVKIHLRVEDDNRIRIDYIGTRSLVACFLFTEMVIGEEKLDKWVGSITCVDGIFRRAAHALSSSLNKAQKQLIGTNSAIPAAEFAGSFDRAIDNIRAGLPQTRYCEIPEDELSKLGCLFSPNDSGQSFPRRPGLLAGSGTYPPAALRAIGAGTLSSCRFSLFDEIFCFLKLSGWEGLCNTTSERAKIADPLDKLLLQNKVGRVLGGAGGSKYAYIDLVLNDVPSAISIIRPLLSGFDLNRNSWLLFDDDALEGEWVGILPDSPPPGTYAP